LRRLSALRADFVALVSHELKSPMTAVIGSAKTLQQRWRELTPTARLVPHAHRPRDEPSRRPGHRRLDTSASSLNGFSYSFRDVDLDDSSESAAAASSPGRGQISRSCIGRCRSCAATRPAAPGADEPPRQRGQVLAGGREIGSRHSRRTAASAWRSATAARSIRHHALIFEVRARDREAGEAGHRARPVHRGSIAEAHGSLLGARARNGGRPSPSAPGRAL
jgi:hypothetical protein